MVPKVFDDLTDTNGMSKQRETSDHPHKQPKTKKTRSGLFRTADRKVFGLTPMADLISTTPRFGEPRRPN